MLIPAFQTVTVPDNAYLGTSGTVDFAPEKRTDSAQTHQNSRASGQFLGVFFSKLSGPKPFLKEPLCFGYSVVPRQPFLEGVFYFVVLRSWKSAIARIQKPCTLWTLWRNLVLKNLVSGICGVVFHLVCFGDLRLVPLGNCT